MQTFPSVLTPLAGAIRGIRLRYFQTQLKADVYQAWGMGARNVLAVLPTGGGKTVTFASILHEYNGASVAIAHRQELVGQISVALARYGVRHKIIAPTPVIKAICRLHLAEVGMVWYDPNARCAVAGVDTLTRRGDALQNWLASVGLWVQDECFPAGTLVDGVPIETLRPGDWVTAFNDQTGEFARRRVVRLFKNPAPKYMVSITAGHHALNCTGGHPIYTRRGWVKAADLTTDDEVLLHELHFLRETNSGFERSRAISPPKNRAGLLFAGVRPGASGRPPETLDTNRLPGAGLHGLPAADPQRDKLPKSDVRKGGADLLQPQMLGRVQSRGLFEDHGRNESKARFGADEAKQPDARPGNPCPRERDLAEDAIWANGSGWQWADGLGGGARHACTGGGLRVYPANDRKNWQAGAAEPLACALQNRRRELSVEAGYRSRWRESCQFRTSGAGREEGGLLGWHGVDGVAVYQRTGAGHPDGGTDDGFVYNIEVEDFHTYVANGVVVHNCHHVLTGNKWGKAAAMFPNARGLGVTATPCRADGKGLGRHAHGLFDAMVLGPTMRRLIDEGYLTDYRVVVAKSDLEMLDKPGASGDWSPDQLKKAARGSHIVGDVVATYQRWIPGKLTVVFAPVVETATEMALAFRRAGIPAEVISADTPDDVRREVLGRFKRRELLILLNVDLFGEGFDLPAIEAVIMARPTESFSLFAQQWGRVLRLMLSAELLNNWDDYAPEQRRAIIAASDKPVGWIIDHVGNTVRHNGPPDARNDWTLDARAGGGSASDAEPITACTNPTCAQIYRRFLKACPYCGHVKPPAERGTPEAVMGDLVELDQAMLAAMRARVAEIAQPTEAYRAGQSGLPHIWAMRNTKLHDEARRAYLNLKDASEWLVGEWLAEGLTISDCHRRFYLRFGVDVLTAYALPKAEAIALAEKIDRLLTAPSIAARIRYDIPTTGENHGN